MLSPENTRREIRHSLNRIAHGFEGTNEELIEALKKRFKLNMKIPPITRPYEGPENEKLDRDISKQEAYQAILECKKKSAPGEDGISNTILRNFGEEQVEALAERKNKMWKPNYLPPQRKHFIITTIPKP